jgi:hypothetical protein
MGLDPTAPAPVLQKEEEEEIILEEIILPPSPPPLPTPPFSTLQKDPIKPGDNEHARDIREKRRETRPMHRNLWMSELLRIENRIRREYSGEETFSTGEETPSTGLTFSPQVHSTPISLGLFKGLPVLKLHAPCETCKCMVMAYEQINFNTARVHTDCWSCECDKLFAFATESQVFNRPDFVWNRENIGTLSQIRTGKLFQ